ncbi:CHD3-type chromatin-remodeling factor PICKLE [Camellia lanceoleosa]|uniref:CHD3-type chromatin-remodeling factor PICKLE n=1 Tax=Camellia lanceoleosa TaxID=1840588 RepID=A0ACC0HBQ2_9ERIC|nr:CHD3-type chromatin-remodeling factor PICKLE [Camellia lanceoleosa]
MKPSTSISLSRGSDAADVKVKRCFTVTSRQEIVKQRKIQGRCRNLSETTKCVMEGDTKQMRLLLKSRRLQDGVPKGLRIEDVLGRIASYFDKGHEAAAEEEAPKGINRNKLSPTTQIELAIEESLKDRYEVQKMVFVEDQDLAGLEDVSSEGEDNNYEAELTDEETAASGILTGRRPYRKKIRVDRAESLPLMEGEGRSFRVKDSIKIKGHQECAVTFQILFPYEDFVELFNWDKRGFPPCGLLNCGNSCFANVVYNVLCTLAPCCLFVGERPSGRIADGMIGAFVNFKPMSKDPGKSHPFSPINVLAVTLILVVTLAMENKRMHMSSWRSYYLLYPSLT